MRRTLIIIFLSLISLYAGAPVISDEIKIDNVKTFLENERIKNNLAELNRFLNDIGKRESGNNWKTYNTYGYIGRFQFGKSALKCLGYDNITFDEFKENPNIFTEDTQIYLMLMLMRLNHTRHRFDNLIEIYSNKQLYGNKITISGLLAGSHIGGGTGLKNLIIYGDEMDKSDAYGTRISDYVIGFSNYDFNLDAIEYAINNFNVFLMMSNNYIEKI